MSGKAQTYAIASSAVFGLLAICKSVLEETAVTKVLNLACVPRLVAALRATSCSPHKYTQHGNGNWQMIHTIHLAAKAWLISTWQVECVL